MEYGTVLYRYLRTVQGRRVAQQAHDASLSSLPVPVPVPVPVAIPIVLPVLAVPINTTQHPIPSSFSIPRTMAGTLPTGAAASPGAGATAPAIPMPRVPFPGPRPPVEPENRGGFACEGA